MPVSRHQRASDLASARPVVGVVGGDATCVRALLQRWTGRPVSAFAARSGPSVLKVPDRQGSREIVVLGTSTEVTPWPGGPLIWLFPERGPSEPELAVLRQALHVNRAARPPLRVLVCLPDDVGIDAASADLDTISETLHWGLDTEVEMELEAVWLSGNEAASLARWLDNLSVNEVR